MERCIQEILLEELNLIRVYTDTSYSINKKIKYWFKYLKFNRYLKSLGKYIDFENFMFMREEDINLILKNKRIKLFQNKEYKYYEKVHLSVSDFQFLNALLNDNKLFIPEIFNSVIDYYTTSIDNDDIILINEIFIDFLREYVLLRDNKIYYNNISFFCALSLLRSGTKFIDYNIFTLYTFSDSINGILLYLLLQSKLEGYNYIKSVSRANRVIILQIIDRYCNIIHCDHTFTNEDKYCLEILSKLIHPYDYYNKYPESVEFIMSLVLNKKINYKQPNNINTIVIKLYQKYNNDPVKVGKELIQINPFEFCKRIDSLMRIAEKEKRAFDIIEILIDNLDKIPNKGKRYITKYYKKRLNSTYKRKWCSSIGYVEAVLNLIS